MHQHYVLNLAEIKSHVQYGKLGGDRETRV